MAVAVAAGAGVVAGAEVAGVVAGAEVVAGVVAVAAVEATGRVGFPRPRSPAVGLQRPSVWLSSRSHPPTTPRGARVDRSFGSSTSGEVYGETLMSARDLCL